MDPNAPTPAPAPSAPAPIAPGAPDTDYMAAALQALSTAQPEEVAAAHETPKAEATADAGDATPAGGTAPAPAVETKSNEPPAAKPPESKATNLLELARQQKAEREAARAKLELDTQSTVKLTQAEQLLRAKESGDPLALLAAAGLSYDQLVQQVIHGKKAPAKAEEQSGPAPEVRALQEKLAALEGQLQAKQTEEARAQWLSATRDLAAKDFKLTAGRKAEARALQVLESYFAETGKLPHPDRDVSIRMALETVEDELKAEAEEWKRILLPENAEPSTQPAAKATVPPATSDQARAAPKTLTNSHGSTPSTGAKPSPQTDEDYQRAALAALASFR